MTIVTGLTAARMLAIEAACIVSGAVSGNFLYLTKYDGTSFNAGNVRGPKGDKGDKGDTGGLTGGTLTGPLYASQDPVAPMEVGTKQYIDASIPTGVVLFYASNTAPEGWHLCNGTAHGSSALQAKLTAGGHANPTLTPNLIDKFVLGAGGSQPRSGGASTVRLTAGQSGAPEHTHVIDPPVTGTSGHSIDHSHRVDLDGGGHGHNSSYGNNWQGSTQDQNPAGTDYGPIGNDPSRMHSVTTDGSHGHGGQSGGASIDHSHSVDIPPFNSYNNNGLDASTAHENMPPFYAMTYIIKK